MARREHINDYFNGQTFMVLCAVALVMTAAVALTMGIRPAHAIENGALFTLHAPLITEGTLSATINVLCLLATGGILLALNKVYTFVRSMTHLFVSSFFLLQIANPSGLVSFNVGTLLCLITVLTMMPLFASYQDSHAQRSIFLVFAIVSAGTMFHYGFLVLFPAFLLGFINLHSLNLKGLLAMILGLLTPYWIVLGMGLAGFLDFAPPHIHGIWPWDGNLRSNLVLSLAVLTSVAGIVLAVLNLLTIMKYRMQTRVYNVFFILLLVFDVVAMFLDFNAVMMFLPLLNLVVAVQIAHVYTLSTFPFRYVLMLLFIATCFGSCVAQLILP